MAQPTQINVESLFMALRPNNIKKMQSENNGVARIKLSDHEVTYES